MRQARITRRLFLRSAGMSVIAFSSGALDAATLSASPESAAGTLIDQSDWAESRLRYGLRPFFAESTMGVIVDVGDNRVAIEMSEGRRGWFEPRGFGDWDFEFGDEVAIGTDVRGRWHAAPAVHRITAPATAVGPGDIVDAEGVAARIPSQAVAREVSALAEAYAGTDLHYLIVRNFRTGEFRVWGAFSDLDPSRKQDGAS